MITLTYVKGLPTPAEELNSLGFTEFEMFLTAYSPVFHKAACETANYLLSGQSFDKSSWNTYLQKTYYISKRHANGVISYVQGAVDASKKNRLNHIKTLEGNLKSINTWIAKSEKKLKNASSFYAKKNWHKSKAGCKFPLSCSIKYKNTNWQYLRFQLHNKKRRAYQLSKQIEHLKAAPIHTVISKNQVFIVGSKDESFGNQVCQWNGTTLKFRVPACLESKFGKYVQTNLGNFERKINRLPKDSAKTWHFYRKNGKWNVGIQFTPSPVEQVSRHSVYGCIGIDLNPGSIGWAYVDRDGNLKAHGQIPLQMGLPSGLQDAQIVEACLKLVKLALKYACPIVCEELEFSAKKEQLREGGRKYARMLSSWAYSRFYELLESILSNRGIYLMKVNPAYTSIIGLVKYARQYGLASDEAAALAIARRGMRLTEKLPRSVSAYLSVKEGKHVWSFWYQLNKLLKSRAGISSRHDYFSISNWELVVKQWSEQFGHSKQKRTSS
ncbi:hypothetical protein WA1_09440 [Scytonema hofmannii PCC 7110]|uniref:Transposase n=1 Tax=Scytonema hofmannii PCC 7110 TaxID=128403 RepID=A0A139WRA7_9CYAN|nr:IS200/IS605 family accessory protein TnpB-related protein [Scytonema hofmannii]KYC34963.1 hypothetical protein WA1_09440 [Scytonema hofmannii PCC 7110]